MRRILIAMVVAVLVLVGTGVLLAQEARPPAQGPTQLTAEQQAVLQQAQDLSKQIEINRLELRLAELKGAPQEELAKKATQGYELRGKLQALWMKNPEVAREAWGERGRRRGAGRGMGPGAGLGQGMGRRHRGGGDRGLGMGRGHGPQGWDQGSGLGFGRGQGLGQGPGQGMGRGHGGRGMGQGMGRGHGGRGLGQGMGRMRGPGTCPWADANVAPPEKPAAEPAPES